MSVLPFTQYLFAKNKTAFDVSDVDDFMEEHRDYHRKQDYQRDKFLRIVEAVNRRQRKPSKDFYYHDSKDLYRSWLRRTNAMEPELGDDTDTEETDTAKEKTTDKDELTGTREGEAAGAGLWAKCAAAAASGCSTQIASKCIDGLVYAGQTAFRATREAAADQPAAAVTKGPEINLGPVCDSTINFIFGAADPSQINQMKSLFSKPASQGEEQSLLSTTTTEPTTEMTTEPTTEPTTM